MVRYKLIFDKKIALFLARNSFFFTKEIYFLFNYKRLQHGLGGETGMGAFKKRGHCTSSTENTATFLLRSSVSLCVLRTFRALLGMRSSVSARTRYVTARRIKHPRHPCFPICRLCKCDRPQPDTFPSHEEARSFFQARSFFSLGLPFYPPFFCVMVCLSNERNLYSFSISLQVMHTCEVLQRKEWAFTT